MPDVPTTRVTLRDFSKWKSEGRKIAMLTAYDFPSAALLDAAGADCILVGDSLGTVVQGWDTTLRVTLDQMVYHAEMVARAAKSCLVIADLPFMTYQASTEQALLAAGRFLKETHCQAVKLEGGLTSAATIRRLVDAGIPVMGHVGLTPQSVRVVGGYRVRRDVDAVIEDARAVAEAGAFALVLECIPAETASIITQEVSIPTIGIGAGPGCDGQVLVLHDIIGLFDGFHPKFVRRYADVGGSIRAAVGQYVQDVRAGNFPGPEESYR